MKKFSLFGLILVVVLGFYFFKESKKDVEKETSVVVENNVGKLKIGVLQLLSHPALDQIYQGLVEELEKNGLKNGDNIELDLQNAQGDQSNLVTMAQKLVSDKNDILVAITTPSALSLANIDKKTPIILAGITYPVEAGLIKSEEKPETNISGVSDRTPIKEQLEIMKEILPELKTLGLLYTSSEDNSIKQIEEAKKAAEELGIKIKVSAISNTNDIQQVTESLASQVEAIFVPIDNTIASAMPTVVKVTDKYKIGVFPSADTMVADGGVLGLGVDQYQIGVAAAKVLLEVSKGAKIEEIPIVLANQGLIYLNETKAQELGINIPEEIKNSAILVDKK